MRVPRFWRQLSVTALAGGLLPVTGDTFVVFRTGAYAVARIGGSVSGATAGDVVRLYSQQFPFRAAASRVRGDFAVLRPPAHGSAGYSFPVTPQLATRYQVRVFTARGALLAAAGTPVVYVAEIGQLAGIARCGRPECTEHIRLVVSVPASTLRTELAKRWYSYLGANLSRTGVPRPPQWLYLQNQRYQGAAHQQQ